VRLAPLLLLAPLGSAAAQHWQPSTDATRLNWGTVNVLVSGNPTRGVQIRAMTSGVNYDGTAKRYSAGFDPELVEPWLNEANAVVTYNHPPTSDSTRALETPPLSAIDGSRLVVRRKRKKNGWESDVSLIFLAPAGGHSWSISAERKEATQFLQALLLAETKSGMSAQADDNAMQLVNSLELDQGPVMLSHPPLNFPAASSPGTPRQDEVWLEYIVGADGIPEPDSFVAVWFDDPRFVDEAVKVIAQARFQPGMVNGHPARALVSQPFVFRVQ
jgi:hypothetical protein